MANVTFVVFAIITIMLLMVSLVFSAMSAIAIDQNNLTAAHKWSMIASLCTGVSIGALLVILIIYGFRHDIAGGVASLGAGISSRLQPYTRVAPGGGEY